MIKTTSLVEVQRESPPGVSAGHIGRALLTTKKLLHLEWQHCKGCYRNKTENQKKSEKAQLSAENGTPADTY